MTYQPDWDVDKARGEQAEGLFRALRSEVLSGTAEVKRDDRARQTGNVYVEYMCQRRDGWHPSGIATTEATTWVIYIEPALVAMPTSALLHLCRLKWKEGHRKECVVGSHPTRGVVIPVPELLPGVIQDWSAQTEPEAEPSPEVSKPKFGDLDHPDTFSLPTTTQARQYAEGGLYVVDSEGWH